MTSLFCQALATPKSIQNETSSIPAIAQDWKYYGSNTHGEKQFLFFDAASITKPAPHYISVETRIISEKSMTNDLKRQLIEARKNGIEPILYKITRDKIIHHYVPYYADYLSSQVGKPTSQNDINTLILQEEYANQFIDLHSSRTFVEFNYEKDTYRLFSPVSGTNITVYSDNGAWMAIPIKSSMHILYVLLKNHYLGQ